MSYLHILYIYQIMYYYKDWVFDFNLQDHYVFQRRSRSVSERRWRIRLSIGLHGCLRYIYSSLNIHLAIE